ncbi:MAG: MFS transporter [Desulfobacterales bacterium]|jgi:MFS family permease|nr:MFS transporter [Desulfobacterales bacterium]
MLTSDEPQRLDKRIFATLFLAIFSCVTGVGIVVPLLPVYANNLGASGLYVGLIFGAFSFSRSVFMPYFGRMSDKKGRKPLIVIGLFCYVLISIAFMGFEDVNALIVLRFIQGIASAMIMPVTQAYVGDITPVGDEGFSMGLFNMSMFMGLSIGPLLGGFISEQFSLAAAFGCMGGMALVGCILGLFLLPPTRMERVVIQGKKPLEWKDLLTDRDILILSVFRFAYTTCIGILWGFLPVYADSQFSLPPSKIGILLMLGVFTSGLIHIPMGAVADRCNKFMLVTIGGLIVVYAVMSFQWATGFQDLFIANVLFGIGGGISMPALMALVIIAGNRTHAMGSVMALLTTAHSLGMLSGSLLAGLIMDISELRFAFAWGAAIMGLGVLLFCSGTLYNNLAKRRATTSGNAHPTAS